MRKTGQVYDRNMRLLERIGRARLRARALAEVAPSLAEGGGRLLIIICRAGREITYG